MSPTHHLGAHYHAREGKRWRPRQLTLWLGFAVDTHTMGVKIDPLKRKQGMTLYEASIGLDPSPMYARPRDPGRRCVSQLPAVGRAGIVLPPLDRTKRCQRERDNGPAVCWRQEHGSFGGGDAG